MHRADEFVPSEPFLTALRDNHQPYVAEQAQRKAEQALLLECAEQSLRTTHIAIASVLRTKEGFARERARIASTLLIRAADDLDCFVTLAVGGFPLQAATIGSALWEKVQCANLVGSNDADAKKWIAGAIDLSAEHPFWRTKHFRRGFEELAKTIDASVTYKQSLAHYSTLCRAKHAHPWIMQHYGFRQNDAERSELVYGPVSSDGWRLAVGEFAPIVLATLLWGVLGFANANEDLLERDDPSLSEAMSRSFALRTALSAQIHTEFKPR